jgi:hypothetical protein
MLSFDLVDAEGHGGELVHELGALLQRKGVFDRYQDRFFRLVRRT